MLFLPLPGLLSPAQLHLQGLGTHPLHLHLCGFVLQGTLQDGLLLTLGCSYFLELCQLWEERRPGRVRLEPKAVWGHWK